MVRLVTQMRSPTLLFVPRIKELLLAMMRCPKIHAFVSNRTEAVELLERIIQLARQCAGQPYLYLKFLDANP